MQLHHLKELLHPVSVWCLLVDNNICTAAYICMCGVYRGSLTVP